MDLEPIDLPVDLPDKPKRRRLTLDDAKAIARLVARRKLNESEACHVLGILPAQWQVFKCRHKTAAMFESIISRTKGLTINHALERLERAGEDQDITLPNGKVVTKRGDWRADAARLPLIDPARFGQQAGSGSITHNDNRVTVMTEQRMCEILARLNFTEPKQLPSSQLPALPSSTGPETKV